MINIEKSRPAPACLSLEKQKKNGDYKCGEVLERIKDDFHNKCYLCEESEPSTINVEHFVPHKGNKDLKFDWNNLFYACGHCNNTKSDKYNDILDCTNPSNIILELLKFEIKPFPKEKVKITALSPDNQTVSTADLLDKIYNGSTKLKNIEAENIRKKLIREIIDFQHLLMNYYEPGVSSEDKEYLKRKIKIKLSPATAFTAFKIWVIKNNEGLFSEFGDLI